MPFVLYSIWHYVGFLVGRRTKIVAGRSRHSVSFYDRVKSLAGRSRHRVSIFNQNPRLTLRSRHLTSFFGQIYLFRTIEGDNGCATLGRKRNPMCFQPIKGRSTRAKREQNARNMWETREIIRGPITQLRHPPPLLLWRCFGQAGQYCDVQKVLAEYHTQMLLIQSDKVYQYDQGHNKSVLGDISGVLYWSTIGSNVWDHTLHELKFGNIPIINQSISLSDPSPCFSDCKLVLMKFIEGRWDDSAAFIINLPCLAKILEVHRHLYSNEEVLWDGTSYDSNYIVLDVVMLTTSHLLKVWDTLWQYPVWGWRTKNQKSILIPPASWVHHLESWSQNILCQWWSGSGVKKSEGSAKGQSHQNGLCTPFRQNHFTLGRYKAKSQGSAVSLISISWANVVNAVCGSCWRESLNCL